MDKEKIPEIVYTNEDLDVGGNFVKRLRPADFINEGIKQKVFTVKAYKGSANTEWGKRPEWIIHDDYDEFLLSGWAFVCKDKFKTSELVGKRIKLVARDEKRLILEILD